MIADGAVGVTRSSLSVPPVCSASIPCAYAVRADDIAPLTAMPMRMNANASYPSGRVSPSSREKKK